MMEVGGATGHKLGARHTVEGLSEDSLEEMAPRLNLKGQVGNGER